VQLPQIFDLGHGEMRYFIEMDFFHERIHDLNEFNGIPIIFSKVLFREKENE
jgi:hypothetical protein